MGKRECECGLGCEGYCVYLHCADPRCNHYICEHSFGETRKIIWAQDPALIGVEEVWEVGCLNADCPCDEFRYAEATDPKEPTNG
jgi:hypothetical protein